MVIPFSHPTVVPTEANWLRFLAWACILIGLTGACTEHPQEKESFRLEVMGLRGSSTAESEVTANLDSDSDGRDDLSWRFQWPLEALDPDNLNLEATTAWEVEMELRSTQLSDGSGATRWIQVVVHP